MLLQGNLKQFPPPMAAPPNGPVEPHFVFNRNNQNRELKNNNKKKSFVAPNLPYTRAIHSEISNMESASF